MPDPVEAGAGGPRPRGGGRQGALTVTQLTQHLSGLIRADEILQDIWVAGEVSNFTRAASGHLYFSLKDGGACLNCVVWRSQAARLPFRLESGMSLAAHGRVSVYAPRGTYQLDVDTAEPLGAGALHLALEQLKARLLAEGLLSRERKRPLPLFPCTVAVVTSASGAAVRDICRILRRDPHPVRIVVVPCQVQGEGAEASIEQALRLANERSGADLILLGRGGGSLEDLWTFNTETVARAIAASRLPVISAVGHETDTTLADLVADLRAPTPTAGAEIVCRARADFLHRLERASAQAVRIIRARIETGRLRLEALRRRPVLARPTGAVEVRRQRLDDLTGRLSRAVRTRLEGGRYRFGLAAGKLDAVSPLATLVRGYAVLYRLPEETHVRSISQAAEGDLLRVRLFDGSLGARVTHTES